MELVTKRRFERTDCQTEALIRYQRASIMGEVENLSLKGLFIKTNLKIEVGEAVEISIFFHGAESELSFSLNATVIRVAENGLGFNFSKIDVDSLALQKIAPGSDQTAPEQAVSEQEVPEIEAEEASESAAPTA